MRKTDSKSSEGVDRRQILRAVGLGLIGNTFAPCIYGADGAKEQALQSADVAPQGGARVFYQPQTEPANVTLIKGNDRRDNIYKSLKLIEDEILGSIRDRRILIKPNFVQTSKQLAATHVDTIRAILDFLKPHYKQQILIGESTANKEGTFAGFKNYGYLALEKEYGVKLVDLNLGSYQYRYTIDENNSPIPIRICSPFLDPQIYIISAAVMKTHGYVVVTLSLKNVLLGAPFNDYTKNDKGLMHKGPHGSYNDLCHFNMFHLAQEVYPRLAVIDGFVGMEGDGPSRGTPIDSRLAVASVDALAADTLGAKVMGFDPKKILYLSAMTQAGMGQGDLERIRILGSPLEDCLYRFVPTPKLNFSAS